MVLPARAALEISMASATWKPQGQAGCSPQLQRLVFSLVSKVHPASSSQSTPGSLTGDSTFNWETIWITWFHCSSNVKECLSSPVPRSLAGKRQQAPSSLRWVSLLEKFPWKEVSKVFHRLDCRSKQELGQHRGAWNLEVGNTDQGPEILI